MIRHLVEQLVQMGLLPDAQHGFGAQRSTLTQLLVYWNSVLVDIEANPVYVTIYLDFSKGYDKCETGVLQHKLWAAKVLGKVGSECGCRQSTANKQWRWMEKDQETESSLPSPLRCQEYLRGLY